MSPKKIKSFRNALKLEPYMVLLSYQTVWESEQQTNLVEMAVQRHKGDLSVQCAKPVGVFPAG